LATGVIAALRKLSRQPAVEPGMSQADQEFVQQAAQDDLAELELGHLAGQRAQDEGIRQLGQRLITDHRRAYSELVSLALTRGFVPPGHLPALRRIQVESLACLPLPAFESRIADNLIFDHRNAVARFQRECAHGDDPALREYAGRMLPTLEEHLRMALALQDRASSAASSAAG
jgi:putative membrane protein